MVNLVAPITARVHGAFVLHVARTLQTAVPIAMLIHNTMYTKRGKTELLLASFNIVHTYIHTCDIAIMIRV